MDFPLPASAEGVCRQEVELVSLAWTSPRFRNRFRSSASSRSSQFLIESIELRLLLSAANLWAIVLAQTPPLYRIEQEEYEPYRVTAQAPVASQPGQTLLENARLFALLDMALADAGIASWDAQYAFNYWRPITAIQQADLDGNAVTAKDTNWISLLTTTPFPEYTSGHSTFSAAASRVLNSLIGPSTGFSTISLGLPGVYRTFTGFTQAANEAGQSRIYGGIHCQTANQDGLVSGRSLGP